jgi:hypothetical protein
MCVKFLVAQEFSGVKMPASSIIANIILVWPVVQFENAGTGATIPITALMKFEAKSMHSSPRHP